MQIVDETVNFRSCAGGYEPQAVARRAAKCKVVLTRRVWRWIELALVDYQVFSASRTVFDGISYLSS